MAETSGHPGGPVVQWMDPATLTPDPGNPRTIDPANRERLRQLLDHYGFVETLVLNARTGELVSGHQRRALAVELRITEVPVMVVDLPDREAKALAVALNNTATQGAWDDELLAARLVDLDDWGVVDLSGFDDAALAELEAATTLPDLDDDSDERPRRGRDPEPGPPPAKPVTEPGDMWQLGEHRLLCADAFTVDVPRLNGGPVDLVLTDPPYAIFGSSTGVASDVADDRMVRPFFEAVARATVRALPVGGHAYIHCDWRSWAALWEGCRAGGLAVRNMIVWDKGSGLGSNYMNFHELIAFCHHLPKASNTFGHDADTDYRPVNAANVIRVPRPFGEERQHHAAKPVELLETLITNSTAPTPTGRPAVILDLFAGSGSTLIAADITGNRCIATEVEPAWCDVIVNRWETFTGGKAVRVPGGATEFMDTAD